MSNIGFYKALEKQEIESIQTAVGDRYVVEAMRKGDYNFGGEQSGHIVFLDYNTTGDGLLTAVQLVQIMKETGKKLSELASEMTLFPQRLVNVRVSDKEHVTENERVAAEIAAVEEELGKNGRVLVRPSGTEPLVRVMVEAPSDDECERQVERIATVVREEMGIA